jgi:hypothetical protein
MIVFLLILSLALIFCARTTRTADPLLPDNGNDTTGNDTTDTTGNDTNLIKYTRTDTNGNVDPAYIDTADWTGSCQWASMCVEQAGFKKSDTTSGSGAVCNDVYPVFPNPCSTYTNLFYSYTQKYRVKILITQPDGSVSVALDSVQDTVGSNFCKWFQIPKTSILGIGLVKVNVTFYDPIDNSEVFSSSGDIKYE